MTIRSHQHGHPAHWDRRPERRLGARYERTLMGAADRACSGVQPGTVSSRRGVSSRCAASLERKLRGQGDRDHVRKLRLPPRTHLQASDLQLFFPGHGDVSKAAGYGYEGSSPPRTCAYVHAPRTVPQDSPIPSAQYQAQRFVALFALMGSSTQMLEVLDHAVCKHREVWD